MSRVYSRSLSFAFAAAMVVAAAAPAGARASDEINVFAWQVTPPGAKAGTPPDLLVGTMHVGLTNGRHLPAQLVYRLAHAKRFAMEVDLNAVNPLMVARYVVLPPDQQNLSQQLPPAEWKKLVALGKAHGLPADRLQRMAPWFISMAFLDLGTPGDALMDARLRAEAEGARVPINFLETAEDQFGALSHVTPKENVQQLEEMLDEPKKAKQELDQLEGAYLQGDLPHIQSLMFGPDRLKAYPDFYQKVFWDRNARWEPKVEGWFAPGGAVVAVGLGHMLGDKGLLALLTKRGYQATPLAF